MDPQLREHLLADSSLYLWQWDGKDLSFEPGLPYLLDKGGPRFPWSPVMHAGDLQRLEHLWELYVEEHFPFDLSFRVHDGGHDHHFNIRGTVREDGRKGGILKSIASEVLVTEESRGLREILDASEASYIIFGSRGNILAASATWVKTFQVDLQEPWTSSDIHGFFQEHDSKANTLHWVRDRLNTLIPASRTAKLTTHSGRVWEGELALHPNWKRDESCNQHLLVFKADSTTSGNSMSLPNGVDSPLFAISLDSEGIIQAIHPGSELNLAQLGTHLIGKHFDNLPHCRSEFDSFWSEDFKNDLRCSGSFRALLFRSRKHTQATPWCLKLLNGTTHPMLLKCSEQEGKGATLIGMGIHQFWSTIFESGIERFSLQFNNVLKNQFISLISHELRTPMNGILGMIQLLGNTDISEEQRELLDHLNLSSDRLMDTLGQLIDYSDQTPIVSLPERVRLHALLLDALATFDTPAAKKGLKIVIDSQVDSEDEAFIKTQLFTRVVQNLISNAIQFTDKGEIRVQMRVLPASPDPQLELTVCDTGVGIPQEMLSRIFQSFFQVDQSLSKRHEGLGLGLSICKNL